MGYSATLMSRESNSPRRAEQKTLAGHFGECYRSLLTFSAEQQ